MKAIVASRPGGPQRDLRHACRPARFFLCLSGTDLYRAR